MESTVTLVPAAFPVNIQQKPKPSPETLKGELRRLSRRIDSIPVPSARHGEYRDENVSTGTNGKTYRKVYRLLDGRKTPVGRPGGGEDKQFRLSLRKRNVRSKEERIRAKVERVEVLRQKMEAAIAKYEAAIEAVEADITKLETEVNSIHETSASSHPKRTAA